MSASGVGKLKFIETIMDQHIYLDILQENLKSSAEKLNLGNFIFQQDRDPKHTAKHVKQWLLYNAPKQLNTPPQSPDMNPIEHLWDEIEE
ncbi:Transposable element Tcb2 transposase [Anthophora quadrimaculata]